MNQELATNLLDEYFLYYMNLNQYIPLSIQYIITNL